MPHFFNPTNTADGDKQACLPPDQKALLTNLKNGDAESFTLLYRTYGKKIYTLAYRLLGNKEDAEDLTQETLLQVYRNIENFSERSQLSTWIYTIAKNLCYRTRQRQKRQSFSSFETLLEMAQNPEIPAGMTTWEKQDLTNQIKEGCLTGLLRCLSFYQRVAFILHVLLDLSIQEAAEILDKSEGATKVLIHRARQNLKGFLCQHCSLYQPANLCRCENLIGFSLKQGWITKPSEKAFAEYGSATPDRVEKEIERLRGITALYKSLPQQSQTESLDERIQEMIQSRSWLIFTAKKV